MYSLVMPDNMQSGFSEQRHMVGMRSVLNRVPYRFEHAGRDWESAIALNAIRSNKAEEILEVGGGGSLFAPAAAWVEIDVTVLDPHDASREISAQNEAIRREVKFINKHLEECGIDRQFDAVLALSVIEHVEDDKAFMETMAALVKPGGLLVITTDFHPSGKALVEGHLRTYNARSLKALKPTGFKYYGGEPDYDISPAPTPVFNLYSFASLTLVKDKRSRKEGEK